MAALAIAAAGAGVGGAIGGSFLGVAAASWGWMVGSVVGSLLFGPDGTDQHGPRLKDATFSGEVEGTDMPILWGGDRLPGKPIWIKDPPTEVKNKEDVGGKGGGGSSVTTYSYFQDFAVCFGDFVCQAPRRVWFNNEIVYDASGNNVETRIPGLSFSWRDGNSDDINSLMEQHVGVGNAPAYKGRPMMVFTALNLTEKLGNRLPVIEAELQTTGVASSSLQQWNMGESGKSADYNGTHQAIRHPDDNTFLSVPLINSAFLGSPVFFTDMASQYSHKIWDNGVNTPRNIMWWTDPWPATGREITHFLLCETCVSCSDLKVFKIEYPSGKQAGYWSWTFASGGGTLIGDSKYKILVAMRDSGVSMAFIDKQTMGKESNLNINTLIGGGASFNAGDFYGNGAVAIDFYNGIFASVHTDENGDGFGLWVTDYNYLSTPTVTLLSTPFKTTVPSIADDFGTAGLGNSPPIFIEETNEIWNAYQYGGASSDWKLGIVCLDADTGEINFIFDFYGSGYTSDSSYWGVASGYSILHFEPEQRRIWWSLSGTGDSGNINVDTRNIQWFTGLNAGNSWAISYPNRNSIWGAQETADEYIINERKLAVVSQGTVQISEVIADICEECGIESSEYDVSQITSKTIGSFVHATRHSGRADIELLLGIAQADAVQSDNKIKFVPRGGAVDVTIPVDDLGAQIVTSLAKAKDPVSMTFPEETDIPRVFEVKYRSTDNVYTMGIAQSYIATGDNISKKTAQLPLALSDQQAADIIETYHQQMVNPIQFRFDLPIRYAYLEPTDIVEVPKGGKNYRVRLTKVERGANWLMQCQGIVDVAENQISTAVAPGANDYVGSLYTAQIPQGIIIDGPLLRDADLDQPGPYLTSFVYTSAFPAASWFYSVDDTVFVDFSAQTEQPSFGVVDTALAESDWEQWDDTSVIRVAMLNGGTLSSSTKSAILADPTINAFAYGVQGRWEYLNAATVTLVTSDPLVYDLSSLLRGRRGTDNYVDQHEAKDYILALGLTGISRQTLQVSQVGNDFYYRIPLAGTAVSDSKSFSFELEGNPLKPYSPINVSGVKHAVSDWAASTAYVLNDEVQGTTLDSRRYVCTTAGTSGGTEPTWDTDIGDTTTDNTVTWTAQHLLDFDMTWIRRTRRGGSLGGDNTLTDGVGGPIGEDSKEYEIDFVRRTDSAVLGTVTGLTTEAYEYLGVDQETHGTDKLGKFWLDVYQKSAAVGRGYMGRGVFDREWGDVINTLIDLGAVRILPLNDVASGAARELVTGDAGTYTSASAGECVSADNVPSLDCDGSGYAKIGTTLRDGLIGSSTASVVVITSGTQVNNARLIDITQGGNTSAFEVYESSTTIRAQFAPKSGNAGVTAASVGVSNWFNARSRLWAFNINLVGEFACRIYRNQGVDISSTGVYSTGNSAYASTFETQSRNTNYNDTIAGTSDSSPSNIRSTGAIGFVGIFDRQLTTTEIGQIWEQSLVTYDSYLRDIDSNICFVKFDSTETYVTTWPAEIGTGFDNASLSTNYGNCSLGCSTAARANAITPYAYRDTPTDLMIDEFTVMFTICIETAPSGYNYLFSLCPKGWFGAVRKGFGLVIDPTLGLRALLGEGGATFTAVDEGTTNVNSVGYYHIACSIHPTNGIKLYVDGTEIGNNGGASTSPDWTDAATGNPPTPGVFVNGYNRSVQDNDNADGYGIVGRYNDFAFFDDELSASIILEAANRSLGVVS